MNSIGFYIFCLIAIVVAIIAIKKVVGCIFRSVVLLILIAALAFAYFYFGS